LADKEGGLWNRLLPQNEIFLLNDFRSFPSLPAELGPRGESEGKGGERITENVISNEIFKYCTKACGHIYMIK